MFQPPGSLGIFFIGIVAGFYFGRFFDANPKLSASALVSLLALLGVGPTALVLVQGYLKLNLLDPYGLGLVAGVAGNILSRSLGGVQLTVTRGRAQAQAPEAEVPERKGTASNFLYRLANTLSTVSSTSSVPQLGTLLRTDKGTYLYGKYEIRPASYEVKKGPKNPAGWVPKADLYEWGEETMSIQPLSLNRIVQTKDEADSLALHMAVQWINEHSAAG